MVRLNLSEKKPFCSPAFSIATDTNGSHQKFHGERRVWKTTTCVSSAALLRTCSKRDVSEPSEPFLNSVKSMLQPENPAVSKGAFRCTVTGKSPRGPESPQYARSTQ